MPTELDPIVGNWYRPLDKGQLFSVVSVDEQNKVIELQHFDGDIEEIGSANWYAMKLELSDAPEDWSGPIDNIDHDDPGYSETGMSGDAWREPLEETARSAVETWEDAKPEDERDDWAEGTTTEEGWQQEGIESTVSAPVAAEEAGQEGEEQESEPSS